MAFEYTLSTIIENPKDGDQNSWQGVHDVVKNSRGLIFGFNCILIYKFFG